MTPLAINRPIPIPMYIGIVTYIGRFSGNRLGIPWPDRKDTSDCDPADLPTIEFEGWCDQDFCDLCFATTLSFDLSPVLISSYRFREDDAALTVEELGDSFYGALGVIQFLAPNRDIIEVPRVLVKNEHSWDQQRIQEAIEERGYPFHVIQDSSDHCIAKVANSIEGIDYEPHIIKNPHASSPQ